MKKIVIVSLASFGFLLVSALCAYLLKYINIASGWGLLGIGVGILLVSGIIAFFAKKNLPLNYLCFFISALSLGFMIRAWYIFRELDNPLWVILLASLACVAYLWLFYLLGFIPLFERHFTAYFWTFMAVSFIGYVVLVIFTETTFVSTFGFFALIEISFIFALVRNADSVTDLIRNVTLSSYSVFAVAVIIIFIVLTGEGDFDAAFDLSPDASLTKKKSPKNSTVKPE